MALRPRAIVIAYDKSTRKPCEWLGGGSLTDGGKGRCAACLVRCHNKKLPIHTARQSRWACKACKVQLDRIPARYALMYDKGVSKLRVHLAKLNQVITPCYLRKAKQFTVEQAIRNRGVTTCRYVVEVPFSGIKAWKFLAGVVPFEDKYLLNDVWWWAVGFHNLNTKPLIPPAQV